MRRRKRCPWSHVCCTMFFLTYAITGMASSVAPQTRPLLPRCGKMAHGKCIQQGSSRGLWPWPFALPTPLQRLQCPQLSGGRPAAEFSERVCLYQASLEERSPGVILGPSLLPDGHVLCAVRNAVLIYKNGPGTFTWQSAWVSVISSHSWTGEQSWLLSSPIAGHHSQVSGVFLGKECKSFENNAGALFFSNQEMNCYYS